MRTRTKMPNSAVCRRVIVPILFYLIPLLTAAGQRPFPNTRDGIHIFYDQPPYQLSDAQVGYLARNYAGCQKIPADLVGRIRAVNPNFIVLNYRLAFGTYDTIPGYIVGNRFVNDWDSVRNNADWFITDPSSPNPDHRIRQRDWGWFLMDISGGINGNQTNGWKEYWMRSVLNQLRTTQSDGVFADSYGIPWNLDFTPAWLQPPADVAWIDHMNTFGNHVRSAFSGTSERFYFIPNVGPWITTRDTCSYGMYADGVMVEMFASPGPWDLYDPGDWELQMNRILDIERRGRIVICQPITEDEWAVHERLYNLANYLLIKGEKTYYNLVFDENFYGRLVFFPEYLAPLGSYKASVPATIDQLFDPAAGLYRREYANGLVLVNPTWDSIRVDLNTPYHMIDADALGVNPRVDIGTDGIFHDRIEYAIPARSITVRPKGGAILLLDPQTGTGSNGHARTGSHPAIAAIYPNPARSGCTIQIDAPGPRHGSDVRIRILDALGRRLYERILPAPEAGTTIRWDGTANDGRPLRAGTYHVIVEEQAGQQSRYDIRSLILLR